MANNFDKILKAYQKSNNFGNMLGMKLERITAGHVIYSMKIDDKHLATPKAAHGGSVAALMDGLLGVTALSEVAEEKKVVATIEFKITFLNPGINGNTLIAEGKTLRKGKKIIMTEGKIIDQETQEVIAVAHGTFNIYPAEKAGLKV